MKDIKKLRNIIYLHNYQYYILNNPLINDEEFDLLFQRLNLLEKRYNIYPTKISNKLRYHFPMLSLNTMKLDDFFKKLPKEEMNNKKIEFCCELKIDGVAINLIYKNKRLIFAGTRGGENITKNIFLIHNIPKYLVIKKDYILPEYCEIRGEIFISKKDFDFLQKNAKRFNLNLISNARNLASGLILRQKIDVLCSYNNIVPHQLLKFYAYNFLFDEQKERILSNLLNNQWKRLNFLRLMDFPVCQYCMLSNTPKFYSKVIKSQRDKISFNIDGVVIKVNNLKLQNNLGISTKYPRWAIAIKFHTNNKMTYIRNIQWNMSRYGVITPIALISPITIAGTTIKKLNLHNYKILNLLDLRLNDAVMIYKAGEVIPQINYVIKSLRSMNLVKNIQRPSHCSFCKSLIRLDPYNNLLCMGNLLFCKKQLLYTITHLLSALNIKKVLDKKLISLLIEKEIISTPVDLFYLTEKELIVLNLDKKRVKYIIYKMNLYKEFHNLLYSLGIPNLGLLFAKKIAFVFKNSLNKLLNCDIEEFKKKTGIGGKIAEKICHSIKEKRYLLKLVSG